MRCGDADTNDISHLQNVTSWRKRHRHGDMIRGKSRTMNSKQGSTPDPLPSLSERNGKMRNCCFGHFWTITNFIILHYFGSHAYELLTHLCLQPGSWLNRSKLSHGSLSFRVKERQKLHNNSQTKTRLLIVNIKRSEQFGHLQSISVWLANLGNFHFWRAQGAHVRLHLAAWSPMRAFERANSSSQSQPLRLHPGQSKVQNHVTQRISLIWHSK